MPYAQWTTIPVHMPSRKFAHYVLLTESFGIEREYIFDNHTYNLETTMKAGIYGFTNLSLRDNFISLANRSSETEIAFIAAVE